MERKPKLVFFQSQYVDRVPGFLQIHKQEHVKCLSQSFDVVVIGNDCDFQQVCDQHEPDLVLVESAYSGALLSSCPPVKVSNQRSCPGVPRVGFFHADAYCAGRAGFLSDMEQWGIETVFAIAVSAPEHTPEIADRFFIWPNFIDPEIYHDYNQWKSIPVLFTGNKNAQYPWRQQIIRVVSKHFPSLVCPHPGYGDNRLRDPGAGAHASALLGEAYARTLNAAWFVPACGTVAKELLRKHLEIPACSSCLITEKSDVLVAAGFIDMENCVFADKDDVVDKIAYLFKEPEKLQGIIRSGHDLVHSHHTLKHRDQLFQWFRLSRRLRTGERIVQESPFTELRVVENSPGVRSKHLISKGAHLQALQKGDTMLWRGKYAEADNLYREALGYIRWMPEPKFRLALCSLYRGDVEASISWLSGLLEFTLVEYKAADPDPVEWAYFLIASLCAGKLKEAGRLMREFPWLLHPELDRVHWVLELLTNGIVSPPSPVTERQRPSLHQLRSTSLGEWLDEVYKMLAACGQPGFVDVIKARAGESLSRAGIAVPMRPSGRREQKGSVQTHNRSMRMGPAILIRSDIGAVLQRKRWHDAIKQKLRSSSATFLHELERRLGYFLPYHLSEAKRDEFFAAIEAAARDESVETALVIGASLPNKGTDAMLAGLRENARRPSMFCVAAHPASLRKVTGYPGAQWFSMPLGKPISDELARTIQAIKQQRQIGSMDLVLINGCECRPETIDNLAEELEGAKLIFLTATRQKGARALYTRLLLNANYELLDQNPTCHAGYGVFQRRSVAAEIGNLEQRQRPRLTIGTIPIQCAD